MASLEPVSPPAAKRQRTEAVDGKSSISEASPAKPVNGAANTATPSVGADAAARDSAASASFSSAPAVTSAPIVNGAAAAAVPAESDDEEEEGDQQVVPEEEDLTRRDMYLDTINRANLDFDFERVCSKSLSNINVYACLVCGKFFQGRGRGSWAYRHAVGENHRVWLNLSTEKFYVLPEGYPVSDPSLNDILAVLSPRYSPSSLPSLSHLPAQPAYSLSNQPFTPGYIGINNVSHHSYLNVIIHLLLHIPPIRTFFLSPTTPQLLPTARPPPSELVARFATLARRLWNPKLFKAQVSPHEFLQEVNKRSAGKFSMSQKGDPVEFLGWLLNTLHKDLGGTKKRGSSVIYQALQGIVRIETQQIVIHKEYSRPVFDIARDIQTITSPFLFLALDLPATPLFQDINEKKIIPQVALSQILAKFDGKTTQEFGPTLKRHHLAALPPYLILHIKRFTKNNFVEERNPTIVNYPLRGIELGGLVDPLPSDPMHTAYDLISNITLNTTAASTTSSTGIKKSKRDREAEADRLTWKIHTRAGGGGGQEEKWFEMQDLRVEEVRRELVGLGETVVQVWERRDLCPKV